MKSASSILFVFLMLTAACQSTAGTSAHSTPESSSSTPAAEHSLPFIFSSVKIVYTDRGKLWFWENGEAVDITEASISTRPTFSSDGAQVAFLRDGALFVIGSDGSDERSLIAAGTLAALAPYDTENAVNTAWVPGKSLILVSTLSPADLGMVPSLDLHVVDVEHGTWRTIYTPGKGGVAHPSPDGKWLAVVSPEQATLMRSDGSQSRLALTFPVYQRGISPFIPHPYWGEDSQSFLLEVRSETAVSIWRVPVIGEATIEFQTTSYRGLTFSPDLSRYAYVIEQGDFIDSPLDLHIASLDGLSDAIVFSAIRQDYGGIGFLGWAPDSESFAFRDTQNNLRWAGIDPGSMQILPAANLPPPEILRVLWTEALQPIVLQVSLGGIWLSGADLERLQVAHLSDAGVPVPLDGFDVIISP